MNIWNLGTSYQEKMGNKYFPSFFVLKQNYLHIINIENIKRTRGKFMQVIKYLELILILSASTYIGILISKKYLNRVIDLKEMKNALNIFITKIKFTYEPIPQIFKEISTKVKPNIGNIFLLASNKMENINAGKAWQHALEESNTNMIKDDIETLKSLSNLLGKVDIEGQVNEIKLVENFLDTQIELAQEDKNKYVKMYRTLGITIGFALVIILV